MSSHAWPIEEAPGRDVAMSIPADFRLASGETLAASEVAGRLHGPVQGPLVVVMGGISSGRFVGQWWSWAVRPGGPIDLNRVRVLAIDLLPGRTDPGVTITTHDQARLLLLLLDAIGEARIEAFVGASLTARAGKASPRPRQNNR